MACTWNGDDWVYCCEDYENATNELNGKEYFRLTMPKKFNFCPYCGIKEEIKK